MKLTEDQIATVKSWMESGEDLGTIQKKIHGNFDLNLTFLETRFLLSDLKLEFAEEEEEEEEEEENNEEPAPVTDQEQDAVNDNSENPSEEQGGGSSSVSVSVDSIAQPQCIISGKVTFSDGKAASWHFDQMSQLGLKPDEEGYTPSQEDVAVFQVELRKVLATQGF